MIYVELPSTMTTRNDTTVILFAKHLLDLITQDVIDRSQSARMSAPSFTTLSNKYTMHCRRLTDVRMKFWIQTRSIKEKSDGFHLGCPSNNEVPTIPVSTVVV